MNPWDVARVLAARLGLNFLDVLPMWSLATLFADEAVNYYLWPASQQLTVLAWLDAQACVWRAHPDDARVIVACGKQVRQALGV